MPPVVAAVVAVGQFAIAAVGALAATAVGSAVLNVAAGFVINAAVRRLTRPRGTRLTASPNTAQTAVRQARTVTQRAPVMPRDIVYGRVRKGGTVIFFHETEDRYVHYVIVLAAHEVEAIGAVYFDEELAIFSNGTVASRYFDHVKIQKRVGTDGQGAFTLLQEEAPDKWTDAHRGAGCAMVYLRIDLDPEVFPTGVPNFSFDVTGRKVFDPRTGLVEYSRNAALCLADYLADPVYGFGATIGTKILTSDLIEAANICDESVPLLSGGNEPRYQINGALEDANDRGTNIEYLLSAMAGSLVRRERQWSIRAGAYRTPVVHLTEADIRGQGIKLLSRQSAATNFNGVRGKFFSPANDWQPDDAPAYQSQTYVDEDQGRVAWADVDLPLTTSPSTCLRLFKIALEQQRLQQTVEIQGMLSAYRAQAGETILLSYARWGFVAKPFEVESVTLSLVENEDGLLILPTLTLRETSPLVFDWDASEEDIYEAAPRTSLPSAFNIKTPGQPQISESLYETRGSLGVRVRMSITWAASPSWDAFYYQVETRRTADELGNPITEGWQILTRTTVTSAERLDVEAGVWEVRIKAESLLGKSSNYVTRTETILGLTAEPSAVTALNLQTSGGLAVLTWDPSEDLDVRNGGEFFIRHSNSAAPSWSNSVGLAKVAGTANQATVSLKPGTYFVRPIDSSGKMGPETSIDTKAIPAATFSSVWSVSEGPAWAGAKTGTEINGSSLQLSGMGGAVSLPLTGLYEFSGALDLGSVRSVRLRSDIDVAALNIGGTIDERLDPIDDWLDFDDTLGAEIDLIVEVRKTDDDPAGSPTWGPWGRLDADEDAFRAAEFRATLVTYSAQYNVLLAGLAVSADETTAPPASAIDGGAP